MVYTYQDAMNSSFPPAAHPDRSARRRPESARAPARRSSPAGSEGSVAEFDVGTLGETTETTT